MERGTRMANESAFVSSFLIGAAPSKPVARSVPRRSHAVTRCAVQTAEYPFPVPVSNSVPAQAHCRSCKNLGEIWTVVMARQGDMTAIIETRNKIERKLTFTELGEKMETAASAIQALGLKKGDCMALFSENSLNWLLLDQGLIKNGCIDCVRGASAPLEELKFIFEDSDSKALAVENYDLLKKLEGSLESEMLQFVVVLQGDKESDKAFDGQVPVYTFEEFLAQGSSWEREEVDVDQSDIATILYTSGTTGMPKGVPLSHGNLLYQLGYVSIGTVHPTPGDTFLSILPCWHIFERTIEYIALSVGTTLVYSSVKTFRDDLQKYSPTILVGVPRLLESLYSTVSSKFNSGSEFKKTLVENLISVSEKYVRAKRTLEGLDEEPTDDIGKKLGSLLSLIATKPGYDVAELLLWKAVREGLGGRLKTTVVGGGSLPLYLEEFYSMAKIQIIVGYGLTETSPVILNRFPSHNIPGSCGLPPPDVDLKIVDPETMETVPDGEVGLLFARGQPVFGGYHKREDATKEVFDEEGYFNTGDLVKRLPQGDIMITGREKDLIVLSNGENLGPQPLEDTITASPLVDQDERFLTALVVPNLENLLADKGLDEKTKKEAEQLLKSSASDAEKAKMEDEILRQAKDKLLDAIRKRVRSMPSYIPLFKVNNVAVVLEPFSVDNGLLTQTLKVRKQAVLKKYEAKVKAMYK